MSAILKLFEEYNRKKKWAKLRKDVKPLELLIGEWHDKQVLTASMQQFINKNGKRDGEIDDVKKLARRIEKGNKKMVKLVERKLDVVF